jgi:CheY-like chemotaxis protein
MSSDDTDDPDYSQIEKEIAELRARLQRSSSRHSGSPDVTELPAASQSPSTSTDTDDVTLLSGARILFVDDDEDGRELYSLALGQFGAAVTAVGSAAAAMTELEGRHFDVIVSDIAMPEHDGYELMHDVRALTAAEGGDTPAVALTAQAWDGARQKALAAGFVRHCPKPCEPDDLARVIVEVLRRGAPSAR